MTLMAAILFFKEIIHFLLSFHSRFILSYLNFVEVFC